MKRPVHYHAAGVSPQAGGGRRKVLPLAFECYWREFRAVNRFDLPAREGFEAVSKRWDSAPYRHTDLRRVTCVECWKAIVLMAGRKNRLGQGFDDAPLLALREFVVWGQRDPVEMAKAEADALVRARVSSPCPDMDDGDHQFDHTQHPKFLRSRCLACGVTEDS